MWKARQRFADGTSADWVGVEGDRRPASVTKLIADRLKTIDPDTGDSEEKTVELQCLERLPPVLTRRLRDQQPVPRSPCSRELTRSRYRN
jgi:hypothetical protein